MADAMNELGMNYSIYDSKDHQRVSGRHYSLLKTPIVRPDGIKGRLLNALHPCLRLLLGNKRLVKWFSPRRGICEVIPTPGYR